MEKVFIKNYFSGILQRKMVSLDYIREPRCILCMILEVDHGNIENVDLILGHAAINSFFFLTVSFVLYPHVFHVQS